MDRNQFLTLLSDKLSEELPRQVVLSNMEYYDGYIRDEINKGRSEESIMEELGDPYLIARTIIEAYTGEAFENKNYTEDVYAESTDQSYDQSYSQNGQRDSVIRGKQGCLILAIGLILAVIVVIILLGSVISVLWPVIAPVLLILLVVSIFSDKRR